VLRKPSAVPPGDHHARSYTLTSRTHPSSGPINHTSSSDWPGGPLQVEEAAKAERKNGTRRTDTEGRIVDSKSAADVAGDLD
jgi:hypothetical protein